MSDPIECIEVKSWEPGNTVMLLLCPFCGGEPELLHIGNDYRKNKKIKIKCSGCRVEITNAALSHDFIWLETISAEHWNRRKK